MRNHMTTAIDSEKAFDKFNTNDKINQKNRNRELPQFDEEHLQNNLQITLYLTVNENSFPL